MEDGFGYHLLAKDCWKVAAEVVLGRWIQLYYRKEDNGRKQGKRCAGKTKNWNLKRGGGSSCPEQESSHLNLNENLSFDAISFRRNLKGVFEFNR